MNDQTERRRYVRIQDTLAIDIHTQEKEPEAGDQSQDYHKFEQLENQFKLAINKLKVRMPDTSNTLKILNEKINLLFQTNPNSHHSNPYTYQQVSISACGIACEISTQYSINQLLFISILLPPLNTPLHTQGKVISCEYKQNLNHYLLRLNFEALKASEEELLIQYVIRRQNEQLKEARLGTNTK